MQDHNRQLNSKKSGFALVELIVVVAIIALLSSLATPLYDNISAKARESEAKIQLSAFYSAEKAFYTE